MIPHLKVYLHNLNTNNYIILYTVLQGKIVNKVIKIYKFYIGLVVLGRDIFEKRRINDRLTVRADGRRPSHESQRD